MTKWFFILFIMFLLSAAISCQDKEIKLLPPENGIYHTAFSSMFSQPDNVSEKEIPYFQKLVGRKIVWLNFSNNWFKGITFPAESVKNIWKYGVIPSLRILPWSKYSETDTTYSLKKIIDGNFDKELKQW